MLSCKVEVSGTITYQETKVYEIIATDEEEALVLAEEKFLEEGPDMAEIEIYDSEIL